MNTRLQFVQKYTLDLYNKLMETLHKNVGLIVGSQGFLLWTCVCVCVFIILYAQIGSRPETVSSCWKSKQ